MSVEGVVVLVVAVVLFSAAVSSNETNTLQPNVRFPSSIFATLRNKLTEWPWAVDGFGMC